MSELNEEEGHSAPIHLHSPSVSIDGLVLVKIGNYLVGGHLNSAGTFFLSPHVRPDQLHGYWNWSTIWETFCEADCGVGIRCNGSGPVNASVAGIYFGSLF